MGIELEGVEVQVDIDWDFRGTMASDRDVRVGGTGIRMRTCVNLNRRVGRRASAAYAG
jgi:hypothetical protein